MWKCSAEHETDIIQVLNYQMRNIGSEAVIADEILHSQAPSNNDQKVRTKRQSQVKMRIWDIRNNIVQNIK